MKYQQATLQLKHRLIRTPLERPARRMQQFIGRVRSWRRPELCGIYLEDTHMHQVMRTLIKRDTNCVDIGCHIGSQLSAMLRLAPEGRHMAFEPIPGKCNWLCRKFPDVDVRCLALSHEDGEASFWEDVDRSGFSGLGQSTKAGAREIAVRCARFDALTPAPPEPIGFMKIDVEGAELLVLRGAAETIRRDRPPIVFESGPKNAEEIGCSRRLLFDYLVGELHYRIYHFDAFLSGDAHLSWDAFDASHRYPFKAFNYLALPA